MSNFFKSVSEILAAIPPLKEWLPEVDSYWAHKRKIGQDEEFERMEEHIVLVNQYFGQLCVVHQLDGVINALIDEIVKREFDPSKYVQIGNLIKIFFVYAIHFHDFGKVNDNFQADPKKMNNPAFKVIPNHPLKTYHSALGAYLFLIKHMQDVADLAELEEDEKTQLECIVLLLSYPIFKHHSPVLKEPLSGDCSEISFGEEVEAMQNYLLHYTFHIAPQRIENLRKTVREHTKNVQRGYYIEQKDFALFALIKLNFSLLTASDYLATHEYMSDAPTSDFGVFGDRCRVEQLCGNLRAYKHNQKTFSQLDGFTFLHPEDISTENLNQLRQEMAVEVIHTIRKNTSKQLFYLEAPTGGGKTNLSMIAVTELLAANPELNKVYYVFPFTTLITQTYKALQDTLGLTPSELVELHSKAGVQRKATNEEQEDGLYGDDKKDYIDHLFGLYPVTVLSHVRFFDILKTNHKETNYQLHRLANSVVIIDELQSYNPAIWDKMLFLISEYAHYFNMRFVLMSATLPKISQLQLTLRERPVFVELLPNARTYILNPNFSQRVVFRFDLFAQEIQLENLTEGVIEKSKAYASQSEHTSVHTIVEFIYKKSASDFYQKILEVEHPFDKILVLSGTILEPRRREIINYLKNTANRDKNILLITTQVVEAGVDIDMDLGFKNISLLDSDEQLAGRVNRNAGKSGCEVYLFRLDDAKTLYQKDERYKVTRDKLTHVEYEEILTNKDFARLYQLVFQRRDAHNKNKGWADNFENGFFDPGICRLNYQYVAQNFKIIDQQNESVFVPLPVPVEIDGAKEGEKESVFSQEALDLLKKFGVEPDEENKLDGKEVWNVYGELIRRDMENRKKKAGFDMTAMQEFRLLQSILSKFTFSLMSYSKDHDSILKGFGKEKYGFTYFELWDQQDLYDYQSGLNSQKFQEGGFI